MYDIDDNELIEFYKNHSIGDTMKEFNISRHKVIQILNVNDITPHTNGENQKLNNLNHGNSFKNSQELKFQTWLNSIDKLRLQNYYQQNAIEETAIQYGVTENWIRKALDIFNIPRLSREQ